MLVVHDFVHMCQKVPCNAAGGNWLRRLPSYQLRQAQRVMQLAVSIKKQLSGEKLVAIRADTTSTVHAAANAA